VSYASTEFLVGSAVLRNETVTMAKKGGCGGVTSFGILGSTNNVLERI
jgi:hypothetical protein